MLGVVSMLCVVSINIIMLGVIFYVGCGIYNLCWVWYLIDVRSVT